MEYIYILHSILTHIVHFCITDTVDDLAGIYVKLDKENYNLIVDMGCSSQVFVGKILFSQ